MEEGSIKGLMKEPQETCLHGGPRTTKQQRKTAHLQSEPTN